jgi:hypothetical protein
MAAILTGNNRSQLKLVFGMLSNNSKVYESLLSALTSAMEKLNREEAFLIAGELTSAINGAIAYPGRNVSYSNLTSLIPDIAQIFPSSLMNLATLTLPWDSFRHSHQRELSLADSQETSFKLVCSIPDTIETEIREVCASTGLWGGTLLDSLAYQFECANSEISIIAPYWSKSGVETLLSRINRKAFENVTITIITQPVFRHENEAISALKIIEDHFVGYGARVLIKSPTKSESNYVLMHAKAIVTDSKVAYLGSANISGRGMDWSVEIGVQFNGPQASRLSEWLNAIGSCMDSWNLPGNSL